MISRCRGPLLLSMPTGLVSGSISSGDRLLSVTVQLTDATSQASVWTESFDFGIEEMPRLEAEIAHAIAANLGASPPVPLGSRGYRDRPVDREVYELYLRGMHALSKSTPADVETGLRYLHEAVDKDPGNADAYAGLALGYATYAHGFEASMDAWPRAAEAAERAIMLDPGLSEAYAALADVKLYMEWDWDGA